jgi:hypothetical protein
MRRCLEKRTLAVMKKYISQVDRLLPHNIALTLTQNIAPRKMVLIFALRASSRLRSAFTMKLSWTLGRRDAQPVSVWV